MSSLAQPRLRVLHYLLWYSHNAYVAHCLDLDIVATATNSDEEAIRRLNILVQSHINQACTLGNYSALSTPAPQEYWDRFMAGRPEGYRPMGISVSGPDIVPSPAAHLGVLAAHYAGV